MADRRKRPPGDDGDKPKKEQKQAAFGRFGFTITKRIEHRGREVQVSVPVNQVVNGPTAADERWKCKCGFTCSTSQGLGSHKNSCHVVRRLQEEKALLDGYVHSRLRSAAPPPGSTTLGGRRIEEQESPTVSVLLDSDEVARAPNPDEGNDDDDDDDESDDDDVGQLEPVARVDGRKGNRGKAKRTQYTNMEKAEYIHQFEMYQEETGKNLHSFVEEKGLDAKFRTLLSKSKGKWRHPDMYDKIMKGAADVQKKKLLRTGKSTLSRALWPRMEHALENDIRDRRKRSARVSVNFIRTRAKQLMKHHYPEEAGNFKASQGWILRFR